MARMAVLQLHLYLYLLATLPCLLTAQPTVPMHPYRVSHSVRSVTQGGWLEDRSIDLVADSGSCFLEVDRSQAAGRRIRLPIVRFHATDSAAYPPVVWFSGGPGQTNMSSLRYDTFIDSSDHIMIGYRGVDGEVSLDCPEIVEVLEAAGDILDTAVIRQVAQGYGACAERLQNAGVDVRNYTAVNVAHDIDEARASLGIDKITIVAESFGTRVAYYYATLYPEHVHRMVLIGANPPGCMVWDPRQNDSLLGRYGELWKQDSNAVRRAPDLVEAIRRVHADFPRRWLIFPIHEGTVKASMNAFLFHRGTAAQGFDAYVAASQGDPSGLWLFSFVGGRIFPTAVNWGDNASKAMSADYEPARDYYRELMPEGSVFGAPMGAFLWGAGLSGKWPVTRIPERFRTVETCSTETLILSGSLDFSTPPMNAEAEFLPHFPNGHHVVMSEAGHVKDLWELQPEATDRLLGTFVRSGRVDTSAMRYAPITFDVAWGFPVLAKVVVAGGLVIATLVAVAAWRFIRVIRRRRAPSFPDRVLTIL